MTTREWRKIHREEYNRYQREYRLKNVEKWRNYKRIYNNLWRWAHGVKPRVKRYCVHCRNLTVDTGICEKCKLFPRCEICSVVMSGLLTSQPSWTNPDRCTDCLDVEDKIKNRCYGCGKRFQNSLAQFILCGNFCFECDHISLHASIEPLFPCEICDKIKNI